MKKHLICLLASIFLLFISNCVVLAEAQDSAALKQAGIYTEWFYQNRLEELRNKFSAEMQKALSLKDLTTFRSQISEQHGSEVELLSEEAVAVSGWQVCERIVRFDKSTGPIKIQWTLGPENIIGGFFIAPVPIEAPSNFLDYKTRTHLSLPFDGEWFTFWGGRKIADNYHAAYSSQRFAADYLIMKNGISYSGDGTKNENYYCFGLPILAPGAGTVLETENNVEDNIPGKMNPSQPMGNYVIIDHGNSEFSFLAHFKNGSIVVKPGDKVKSRQLLGSCGNSGNSSEAHLHYHMQNNASFNNGEGLPAQFQSYMADNIAVSRGEPVRGQIIRRVQ